jgi:hypothetical protein
MNCTNHTCKYNYKQLSILINLTIKLHNNTLCTHYRKYPCHKGNAVRINTKQAILEQISFKQMDDDHKENVGMLINFNYVIPGSHTINM